MLGLDGRALVDEFKRQYRDPSELDVAPAHGPRGDAGRRARERPGDRGRRTQRTQPSRGPGRPPIAVVTIVLVILLAGALYLVGALGKSNGPSTTTSSTLSTTTRQGNTGATGTSHSTTPTPPTRVAVQFKPSGRVYVCLVGYPLASAARAHVRLNGILTAATHEPVYHDNHFRVTLGNNAVTLRVNGHDHRFAASSTAIAVSVSLDGTVSPLSAGLAPHCA